MTAKLNGSAFPFAPQPQPLLPDGTWDQYYDPGDSGQTLREYAAVHLRVPDSGNETLDAMIRRARVLDFSESVLRCWIGIDPRPCEPHEISSRIHGAFPWLGHIAEAMLAELEKRQSEK